MKEFPGIRALLLAAALVSELRVTFLHGGEQLIHFREDSEKVESQQHRQPGRRKCVISIKIEAL